MGCQKKNMFKTISRECDLQALKDAIVSQGLEEAIATQDPITVFGPTNKAFKKFEGCDQVEDLTQLLLYHVVPKYLKSSDFTEENQKYKTLFNDKEVRVNVYSSPTFNDVITVNGSIVVEADIKATNGVLHKIKRVLCPPAGNVAEIAASNPDFSTLVEALVKAGLVEAVSTTDPITVFAPTNQAFQDLFNELGITKEELLDLPNLADILLYHVLGQTVFSPAIKCGKTRDIPTLNGKTIDLKRCNNICIRDKKNRLSKVILPDILAKNGVIHAIDKVLLP